MSVRLPHFNYKVSLTMIVRDEEKNLPCCLESVRGLFDEIVIVDTGSKDRTKEIASKYGACIIDFVWIDDFAAARNASLAAANGDYAFWLDADDVIELTERDKLAKLFSQLVPEKNEAYLLRCSVETADNVHIVVDQPRLFPLLNNIRWENRIHEQIIPSLTKALIPMRWTDIVIRHMGYTDPVVHEQKRQRNLKVLFNALAENPNDPYIYYYLGTHAFEKQNWQESLGYFILSLAKWGPRESIACKIFAMIAWTNEILKRYDESLRVCNEGLFYFPDDGELLFRKAVAQRYRGETSEAADCWTRILQLDRPQKLYHVDPGIFGHLTRRNLAIIAEERGDLVQAKAQWQAVLKECPEDPDALRHIISPANT